MSNNIHPVFDKMLTRKQRQSLTKQISKVLWFTGLSGSGKSTIAIALEKALYNEGIICQALDGDNIRSGINNNLGFSLEDREENTRRIAEIAKLYLNTGITTLNSFVSPTNEIRDKVRDIIGADDFLVIYVNAPIEVCEKRDVKGLYKKARKGEIKNFTGIDSPFEEPIDSFLEIKTDELTVAQSVEVIMKKILPVVSKK